MGQVRYPTHHIFPELIRPKWPVTLRPTTAGGCRVVLYQSSLLLAFVKTTRPAKEQRFGIRGPLSYPLCLSKERLTLQERQVAVWSATAYSIFAADLHICRSFDYPPPVDASSQRLPAAHQAHPQGGHTRQSSYQDQRG